MKKIVSILTFLILSSNSSFSNEINIDTFFNKFNMRSTLSSMGPQLRYWCGSYPSEFFEIKEKKISVLYWLGTKTSFGMFLF